MRLLNATISFIFILVLRTARRGKKLWRFRCKLSGLVLFFPRRWLNFQLGQLTLLYQTDHVNLQSPPVSSAGIVDGGKRHDFKATPFETMG